MRYCRYGDTSLLLEWVHGGRTAPKAEKEKETRRPSQEEQPTAEEPDYSKYRFWSGTVANEELHSLFMEVVDYLNSLGEEVWVEAKRQECIAKPRPGAFFNICYFRPQPQKKRIRIDIPGRDGPRIYVASSDDFEDEKEKLQRAFVAAIERSKT